MTRSGGTEEETTRKTMETSRKEEKPRLGSSPAPTDEMNHIRSFCGIDTC